MPRGRFPPLPLAKYPHLLGSDVPIWQRFIVSDLNIYDSFDYDVHVGQGQETPDDLDPTMREMFKALTQRRIDVVGWRGDFPSLIEVKKYAGVSAIGQILCYRVLWQETFEAPIYPDLVLLTDFENRDTKNLCLYYSIQYIII